MRIALAILVATVLLSPVRRELYVGDETKYGQVVREMREGSFFLPTLEGSAFTHKPPLHFWIVAALTYPFGIDSIWPFVLPSIIAFVALMWLLHRMEGPLAAFVGGTSLLVWGSAQTARMDVQFTALLVLAAWMLQRFFDGERTLGLAGIATGFAMLIKGPMAPVIILFLFGFEALRRRRVPPGNYGRAIAWMILIPLLWLVPAVLIGGEPFWREVFFKQTVGRAVGSWVHQSPPWFYLVRAPMTLAPWFFLAIVAIVAAWKRGDERAKFYVSWIAAVLVPYSLLSSKLDVYMMAMIPPVALAIARLLAAEDRFLKWGSVANGVMAILFLAVAIVGLLIQRPEVESLPVRALFAVLGVAAIVSIAITIRGRLVASTIALGFATIAALTYAAVFLVPLANEMASTRPLVRVLKEQNVPPEEIALYVTPHLWARGMPESLARARHVNAEELRQMQPPRLIVARRKDSGAIRDVLRDYRRVDELQMIGKWFDVYRK